MMIGLQEGQAGGSSGEEEVAELLRQPSSRSQRHRAASTGAPPAAVCLLCLVCLPCSASHACCACCYICSHAMQKPTAAPFKGRPRLPAASGRSGAGSRGWTAFTAFGIRNRQAVRAAHPQAGAGDVEKVGRHPGRPAVPHFGGAALQEPQHTYALDGHDQGPAAHPDLLGR